MNSVLIYNKYRIRLLSFFGVVTFRGYSELNLNIMPSKHDNKIFSTTTKTPEHLMTDVKTRPITQRAV